MEEIEKNFDNNLKPYENKLIKHKTTSNNFFLTNKLLFDLIYIDGLHTYDQVNKDIDNYKPLIVKGGFIGGHDYHPVWGGVVQSINEKVGEPNKTFQDTSWVVKID